MFIIMGLIGCINLRFNALTEASRCSKLTVGQPLVNATKFKFVSEKLKVDWGSGKIDFTASM